MCDLITDLPICKHRKRVQSYMRPDVLAETSCGDKKSNYQMNLKLKCGCSINTGEVKNVNEVLIETSGENIGSWEIWEIIFIS